MNITPIRAPNEFDLSEMSISDDGNSPYINVRDYQGNVKKLTNDNFTLKLVLYGLYKDLRTFLKSNKIQDDVIETLIEQENTIAKLTAEIGQIADSAYNKISGKLPPQSPSLKQRLESALDLNRQLMSQLKEKENQQLDNVVDSIVFDNGVHADIANLELNRQIEKLKKENQELAQKVDDLTNDVQAFQKEKEQDLQTISNLNEKLKTYEDLENVNRNEKNELESQIAQLQREQITPDDIADVMKQLEQMSDKNTKLLQENIEIKQKFQVLEEQQEKLKPKEDQNSAEIIKALTIENEKLKETNLLQQETKFNFYRKISKLNNDLKGKIQYLKLAIDRLNAGDYSILGLPTQISKYEDNYITSNIDVSYKNAMNDIEKLVAENDDLNKVLDTKLYEKIDELTRYVQDHKSPKKNSSQDIDENLMNEIVDKNAELLEKLTNAQNDKLKLEQQVEIFRQENEDLTNENDVLRSKIQPGSSSSIIYMPTKNNGSITRQKDNSLIEDLQRKNLILENEIEELRNAKQSNVAMKNQITTPIKRSSRGFNQNSFNNSHSSIDGTPTSISQKMIEMQKSYDNKVNAFLNDFEDKYHGLIVSFHRLINIIIQIAKSINSANRDQIRDLATLGGKIIQDMKKGASISIKASNDSHYSNSPIFQTKPLLTRDDRKKLSMLQKKWNTLMAGNLGKFIKEENEKSMLLNDGSFIKNENEKNIMNELFMQLKVVIESIWKEFGSGSMPRLNSFIDWKENGAAILQDTLQLFTMSVISLRESNQADEEDAKVLHGNELNPKILSILSLVRKDVNRVMKQMHEDHQELIMIAQEEL